MVIDSIDSSRLQAAVERFDAANRQDPNHTLVDGRGEPDALLYARRMTEWLGRLAPHASEPLRLAARCQHLCRWMIPRDSYPMTRPGYHQWRTALAKFHAERAGEILRDVGYDAGTVARVQSLVRKEGLKSDPETQTLEDAACLVFLEHYFADFAARHDEPKVLGILAKTWQKMSPRGRDAALGLVEALPAEARRLVEKAVSSAAGAAEATPAPPPTAPDATEGR